MTSKTNKKGYCPLSCRLTFENERKQFTTGLFINPKNWNNKLQLLSKNDPDETFINTQISTISDKLKNITLVFQLQREIYTLEDIYKKYLGIEPKQKYHIVSFYNQFLQKQKKLVGIEIKGSTYQKFSYVSNQLESFVKWKFKSKDYPVEKLNLKFLEDFEYYLKTEKKHQQITINKTIQRFRTPFKSAIAGGIIDRDPFLMHKTKKVKKEIVFLSPEELKLLEYHSFAQNRLTVVRDLFVFCCYTGLAYAEMSNLKKEHIIIGFDAMEWIQMKREKTDKMISVPILPKAQSILEKYSDDVGLLPKFSNQKINSYLKEIAEIIGVDKKITHHMARKTFASTVLLFNDVPMEIVSELLGHSNILITQESYGKVVQKKVSQAMSNLRAKLK
ncbi:site-specific integrase [Flavobacterium sp.]|uniref:site-specific integrase n=1 Tax=Flavobacterium sp. TaxID=239 RepID=UPI002C105A29|nr:site-specific integrase [Flavobacterium sp.]HSD08872.1 site-specific integrase [Flavobacterium sp.]